MNVDINSFKKNKEGAIENWKNGKFDINSKDSYIFNLASMEAEIIAMLAASETLIDLRESLKKGSDMYIHITAMIGIFSAQTVKLTHDLSLAMGKPLPFESDPLTEGKIQ